MKDEPHLRRRGQPRIEPGQFRQANQTQTAHKARLPQALRDQALGSGALSMAWRSQTLPPKRASLACCVRVT